MVKPQLVLLTPEFLQNKEIGNLSEHNFKNQFRHRVSMYQEFRFSDIQRRLKLLAQIETLVSSFQRKCSTDPLKMK